MPEVPHVKEGEKTDDGGGEKGLMSQRKKKGRRRVPKKTGAPLQSSGEEKRLVLFYGADEGGPGAVLRGQNGLRANSGGGGETGKRMGVDLAGHMVGAGEKKGVCDRTAGGGDESFRAF